MNYLTIKEGYISNYNQIVKAIKICRLQVREIIQINSMQADTQNSKRQQTQDDL